jgi:catalase
MPLPSDEKVVKLANDIVELFYKLAGSHPGYRPAHAKGLHVKGTFTSAPEAAALTRAPHIERKFTPVVVRFSDGGGLPMVPDNDPGANPRGMAVRFYLAEHIHTDIVAHSVDSFPAKDGPEFLEFLRAAATGQAPAFISSHPAAQAFFAPRPFPASFATQDFFAIVAYKFTNGDGESRYGRYRIIPQAGLEHLDDATAKSKGADYLFNDIKERLTQGPIQFNIQVQVAEKGDVVNDATVHWPANRPIIPFGTLTLTELAPEDETQKKIIFDPIPRVEGIEPSDDPFLELRAAAYLISGRRRRQAAESPAQMPQPV